jgi:hypothetical protein
VQSDFLNAHSNTNFFKKISVNGPTGLPCRVYEFIEKTTTTMKSLVLSALLLLSPLLQAAPVVEKETCVSTDQACAREKEEEVNDCSLYLAPSVLNKNGFGVYTSVDLPKGTEVGEPDLFIPIVDRFKLLPYRGQHRWLSWLDYIHGFTNFSRKMNRPLTKYTIEKYDKSSSPLLFTDGPYWVDAIAPGLASQATADAKRVNVLLNKAEKRDSAGLHRSKDHGTGAFTSNYGVSFSAKKDIPAGSEIYINAEEDDEDEEEEEEDKDEEDDDEKSPEKNRATHSLDWLQEHGMCIDNLRVGPSTATQAGRGAFVKRSLPKGSVISPTSLAVLKRDDLIIYETNVSQTQYKKVVNTDKSIGTELILNYCFGHPDSPLLLLPLGPMVNFINHNASRANAEIRWPREFPNTFLKKHPLEVLDLSGKLLMEFVATRDIQEGEEIFINYGQGWEDAWIQHEREFHPSAQDKDVLTAQEYLKGNKDAPLPDNLMNLCRFANQEGDKEDECWLPCTVGAKKKTKGETLFDVSYSRKDKAVADKTKFWSCASQKKDWIDRVPAEYITVVDKMSSFDTQLEGAFRHEIGVPQGFFPSVWMQKAVYEVADLAKPLEPGEFRNMTWKHNGEPITENAYWVGLPENFTNDMRAYAERIGVLAKFRDVLYEKSIEHDDYHTTELAEGTWYVQRPHFKWNSNQHWISPYDEEARVSYLRAIGTAGFDEILDRVGRDFGLKGLMCYHNSFIGVSRVDESFMHTDFMDTNLKSFNILFSLVLEEGSAPELDLGSQDENIVVGVKYGFENGVNTGDWTWHKTAAVDYAETGGMRVIGSVYCSEINDDNVKSIAKTYKGEAPAPFKWQFDMPIKEWHWLPGQKLLPK